MQVQKARLQKSRHPSCSKQAAQAANFQQPATAPGPLRTSHKEVLASLEGHQLASPVQSSHASEPLQESSERGATPHDCKTPHHSMLPAPGANMLSEAGHAIIASTLNTAGLYSGHEDPIVVTAGHSRQQSNKSMPRRKPGSKTWNTLNFQQAQPSQALLATHPLHASSAAHAPSDAFHRHQCPPESKNNAASTSAHDATGSPLAHLQHGKYQHLAQTQLSHGCPGSAPLPSLLPCVPASCAAGENIHAEADHARQAAHAASQDKVPFEVAAAAVQSSMAFEGSETQPDPHIAPTANPAVCFGTPCAAVLRPWGLSAKREPGVHTSRTGPLNADGASPACQNVPDSSGNTFAASEAHAQHFSQPSHTAPAAEGSTTIASCSTPDEQGWHLQLDDAVIALVAQGR